MNERLFLHGKTVIGFGETDNEMAFYRAFTNTRIWTGIGAVLGGAAGIAVGAASARSYLRDTESESSANE